MMMMMMMMVLASLFTALLQRQGTEGETQRWISEVQGPRTDLNCNITMRIQLPACPEILIFIQVLPFFSHLISCLKRIETYHIFEILRSLEIPGISCMPHVLT